MTSPEPINGKEKVNNGDIEKEDEPKRSFRVDLALKSQNNNEKKRKDKIGFWINKISELLPEDTKKRSKNGILEKAYYYMVRLKEINDKLITANQDQITGEGLQFAEQKVTKLEETSTIYYKMLKIAGITPDSIPSDVLKPQIAKNATQDAGNLDEINPFTNSGDDNSEAASDTTELIRDEDTADQDSTQNASVEKMDINSLFQKTPLLVVNQNQDQNVLNISLSNGSQLKFRPSPNVQVLSNGALAIDSSELNQGQIILGSTLLSPPQPKTLLMSNGQLISMVDQSQPAFVYSPGAGFILTSSTAINNSINASIKSTEQAGKKKGESTVINEPEVNSGLVTPETEETQARPIGSRKYQKFDSKQTSFCETSVENDQSIDEQQNETLTPVVRPKRPRKALKGKLSRKAKETSDKLTIVAVNLQSDESSANKKKRPRSTTVIEKIADFPDKRRTAGKKFTKNINANKGSTEKFGETLTNVNTSEKLMYCDDLTDNDLKTENRTIDYSFRQNTDNNEAACDQDQLPLLYSNLSDDNEMSNESVHSVSNPSLPTFLNLSPAEHLTDFISKTADPDNAARSPRYSSPINRLDTSATNSQTPSVIMSNQGTNLINEPSNCQTPHHLLGQNDKDHMFEDNLDVSDKSMGSEMRGKDSNISMCGDENYSVTTDRHHQHHESDEVDKSTNSLTEIGVRKSSKTSTSSSAVTSVTTDSLSSNVNTSSSPANNSVSNQEHDFQSYSAESHLRQQSQQQSTPIPTSGPINLIYHDNSNVDPDIDSISRPNISYSAERLIHSPPMDATVSVNQSYRHKSHETKKALPSSLPNSNQTNNSSNIYNEQYSMIQKSQDQQTNQDQNQSCQSSNPTCQSQQQIMHQQRNVYSENHLHHHQQPSSAQSSRSQTQANSSPQGQIMKTTSTSDSSTTNNNNGRNSNSNPVADNYNTNNGREIFNHPYPYSPMPNDGSSSGYRNANHSAFTNNGNHHTDGFIENNSQNNFISSFAHPNNNCQSSFTPTNNRRSGSSSTTMIAQFPFSDPGSSFSSDPYSRTSNTPSSNANSVVNFDTNRRIGNSGHFVDHTSSSTPNNPNNNYFMMHNHHIVSSPLPTSNNPPIFSTSSSFTNIIAVAANSNYDNNGYNLTCPPKPSVNVNTSANVSSSSNSIPNSNFQHHSHHSVFYGDANTVSMHNSRHQSELSPYSASNKTVNNGGSSGSSKTTNNATASSSPTNPKQLGKSVAVSSKSTKKFSAANVAKSRGQSSNNEGRLSVMNPPVVNSYTSMPRIVPSPSPSSIVNHRSVVTPSSSERQPDGSESVFRPQPQSNSGHNMQTSSNRPAGSSSHSLIQVGHSSAFLPNFSFPIFTEIGSINPNENFAMSGLSAIKFNHANHVIPHHPNPNAPFTHSSALQAHGSMDNNASSMGDNSSHQNIYGHPSRISTHHHNHVSFIPLIGTSPRTFK